VIAVRLTGGLGNQLFQYAAARAVALRNETKLILDSSWIDGNGSAAVGSVRRFELGCFELDAPLCPITEVAQLASPRKITRRLQRVSFGRGPVLSELAEPPFGGWCPEIREAPDNTYLTGYWHSSRYFEDAEALLRAELTFKNDWDETNTEIAALIGASELPTVSAHVRRGDYVTDPGANRRLGTLEPDYYHRAVAKIEAAIGSAHVLVFSDEPEWCRAHLETLGSKTTIVDVNAPSQAASDLRLMTLCEHHVVANSTFSWWGAWLNPSPEKIVVAPEPWLIDTRWPGDLRVPASWVKLPRSERIAAPRPHSVRQRDRARPSGRRGASTSASWLSGLVLADGGRARLAAWGLALTCALFWTLALMDGAFTTGLDMEAGVGGTTCLVVAMAILLLIARRAPAVRGTRR